MNAPTPLAVIGQLRRSLDAVARALAEVHLDGLLAAETDLAAAVDEVKRLTTISDPDGALAAELSAVRTALQRCRTLGGSLTQFAECTLVAAGHTTTYERPGTARAPSGAAFGQLRASL